MDQQPKDKPQIQQLQADFIDQQTPRNRKIAAASDAEAGRITISDPFLGAARRSGALTFST